jgi:hypothetical protein
MVAMSFAIRCFLILMITTLSFGKGKTTETDYEITAKFIKKKFNKSEYDEIFLKFSKGMKRALPEDKSHSFFSNLKSQLGDIKSAEFSRYEKRFAVFKTYFNSGIMEMFLSVNKKLKINGFTIKQYVSETQKNMVSKIKMRLPFEGKWYVFWGGDTKKQNYHVAYPSQKNAFDFVIRDKDSKSFKGQGKSNQDYYAFGQKILSPVDLIKI